MFMRSLEVLSLQIHRPRRCPNDRIPVGASRYLQRRRIDALSASPVRCGIATVRRGRNLVESRN